MIGRVDLLCFGPYPTEATGKDGMAQRVAVMDDTFRGLRRVYVASSTRRWFLPRVWLPADGCGVVFAMWPFSALIGIVLAILTRPRAVYLHSLYEVFKNPLFLLATRRTFLDAHGLVPEEEALAGHRLRATVFEWLERTTFTRLARFIAVTDKMVEHFDRKYPPKAGRTWFVIPVMTARATDRPRVGGTRPIDVIYLGGLQAWQNIPEMIDVASLHPKMSFRFVVNDLQSFTRAYGSRCSSLPNVTVGTCSPIEAPCELGSARYGLVLRDDIPINRVACPTKVLEYVVSGVVPVFGKCDLGDFVHIGLKVVRLGSGNEFAGTDEELDAIRTHNHAVSHSMRERKAQQCALLRACLVDRSAAPGI